MSQHSQREHRVILWVTEREAKACERFITEKYADERNDLALTRAVLRQLVQQMEGVTSG